jgi:hypothetical protein
MEWSQRGNPVSLKVKRAKSTAEAAYDDRRSEERFPADGSIELRFEDPICRTVEGSLRDYSNSGFRATHCFHSLHTGQLVEFRHGQGAGQAKVMWNRISQDGVETGFLVLQEREN